MANIFYQIEDGVPIPDSKTWDESFEEFQSIKSLQIRKAYTFTMDKINIVRSIQSYLTRTSPMRFFFRQVTKTPPVGRLFRVEDGARFKTFKNQLTKI